MVKWAASMINVSILTFLMFLTAANSDAQEIRLLVRGDDLGMTQGSLAAFEKAFNEGVLTCGSILVCAPWFEGAADLCRRNPQWCVGVHLSLVGEWRGYRWRPVLPWDQASSLVDEDGFLYASPEELWAHKPNIEEIAAELRGQINLALKKGLTIQYIDTHYMGYSSYPGLTEVLQSISNDYNLPLSGTLGEKRVSGIYRVPVEQKTKLSIEMLEKLNPGLWLWVTHPGIDSPEQDALIHTNPEDIFVDGGVGKHRAAETEAITSLEVKSVIMKKRIRLTSYRELREEKLRGLDDGK